jgi:hypothetical protein
MLEGEEACRHLAEEKVGRKAGFLESARAGYFEGGQGEFLEQQEWEALNRKRMEGWVGR